MDTRLSLDIDFDAVSFFMKIGMLTYDFYPAIGGQGVEAYSLYRELKHQGSLWEPHVMSGAINSLTDHTTLPAGRNFIGILRFSFYANRHLESWIRKEKIDLVQAYGGPGGVFLLRKPSVPLIYIANHTYDQQFNFLARRPYYTVLKRLEHTGYRNANAIVAISTTTRKNLVQVYEVPPDSITVIPPGLSEDRFTLGNVARTDNEILYVGRLDARKGLDFLITAFAEVVRHNAKAILKIAGTGKLKNKLQQLATNLGIFERVVFLGKVSDVDLKVLYQSAAIFVLPSKFEGFGIVLTEAMACGTPVVGTDVPGIIDIVEEGHGRLVEQGNTRQLADMLRNMLNNRSLRSAMGKKARKMAMENYHISIISRKFTSLYGTIMSKAT